MVLSWFWLAGWQNPAHPACGGSGRAGRREQEQHCGMRGRTAGQLRPHLGSGPLAWPLGSGHCWPGPLAVGTAGPAPWQRALLARAGAGAPPAHPERSSQRSRRSCRSQHLTALAWTHWSSGVLYFWVWDAMLKQLELQPKQLMIEKEENGNTLKHGCVILQLCHRIPPQLFRLAERIIQ